MALNVDLTGLLYDGVVEGLLHAPVVMAFGLLYAHRRDIDVSLDGAVVVGGVAYAMAATAGHSMLISALCGVVGGASVTLLTGAVNHWLRVPYLLTGILVGFVTYSASIMMVGEGRNLFSVPRVFAGALPWLESVWLGSAYLLAVAGRLASGWRPRHRLSWILLVGGIAVSAVGGQHVAPGRVSLHVGVLFAAFGWAVVSWLHNSDLGLAHRALGSNSSIRLRTSPWRVRASVLLLVGVLVGLTGVVLSQKAARARGGGGFDVVVGALTAYLVALRLMVLARQLARRFSLRPRWRKVVDSIAHPDIGYRAVFGALVFHVGNQVLIAVLPNQEAPKLVLAMVLLILVADSKDLGSSIRSVLSRPISTGNSTGVPSSGVSVLDVQGLSKSYPRGSGTVEVLREASFEIPDDPEARLVRISGFNAAGKSTLLKILDGRLDLDRGRVVLFGKEIQGLPQYRRPVFLICQDPQDTLAPDLTIAENLRLSSLRTYGLSPASAAHDWTGQARRRLMNLGVGDTLGVQSAEGMMLPASALSGGQAQLLALASAIAAGPDLVLADEPTASLDPENAAKVVELLRRVSEDVPVLVVTHDDRATSVFTRRYLVADGKITPEGM